MAKGAGIKKGPSFSLGSGSKASMKYRPSMEVSRSTAKGTKLVPEAASIQHILTMMVVHISRKILYGLEIAHRVGIYIVGCLILSVIGDFSGESNGYFAAKDNFFNEYFVKYGFGWTLLLLGPFVYITSNTTGCGRPGAMRSAILRLVVNTMLWFSVVYVFDKIEEMSGMCSVSKVRSMAICKAKGHSWRGLDLSGHCYLLISCNLTVLEEAKAYLGWERIKDMLRNEEHKRLSTDLTTGEANGTTSTTEDSTSLSKLSLEEFMHLRSNYKAMTIPIRVLFCLISLLVILWDVMLFFTAVYFHIMIEKVIASCCAVVLWFFLYRVVFSQSWCGLPGQNGPFKYVTYKSKILPQSGGLQRKDSLCRQHREQQEKSKKEDGGVPKFMGMPIYGLERKSRKEEEQPEPSGRRNSADYGKLRARSRSSSCVRLSSRSSLNNLKYL